MSSDANGVRSYIRHRRASNRVQMNHAFDAVLHCVFDTAARFVLWRYPPPDDASDDESQLELELPPVYGGDPLFLEAVVLQGGASEAYLLALREKIVLAEVIEEPPDAFVCPITTSVMSNPVVLSSGNTYEKASITEWLAKEGTCPQTRAPASVVAHNVALRTAIEAWATGVLKRATEKREAEARKLEEEAEAQKREEETEAGNKRKFSFLLLEG
jgi:hypothetical protein